MKYRKQHIEVPFEIRHFNSSNYRRSGIKDIVNLDDYVETIVQLVDARNAEQEIDGWRDERLFRELMDFSDYLLKILKETSYRDAEAFLVQSNRIKSLEMSLGLKKKPVSPKSAKKEPDDDEQKRSGTVSCIVEIDWVPDCP